MIMKLRFDFAWEKLFIDSGKMLVFVRVCEVATEINLKIIRLFD